MNLRCLEWLWEKVGSPSGRHSQVWKSLIVSQVKSTFPGKPPYTGGIHDTMYRSRLWTMRQYAGFSSAKETNERFKLLLSEVKGDYLSHLIYPPN